MCDPDADRCDVWRETWRNARKSHTCFGCKEPIEPSHRYCETANLYDGRWTDWKHCRRCATLFGAIADKTREVTREHVVFIEPDFSCGETWLGNFGQAPPEVEALAFALPPTGGR